MDFQHTPVLLEECISRLNIKEDGVYVDGTLGGCGHAGAIGKRLGPKGLLIGIDRDQDAIDVAGERLAGLNCQVRIVKGNFMDIKEILREEQIGGIDGGLLDLGVSSHQLDEEERGFSYMNDAPLDMRMDRDQDFTAEELVNEYSREELARVIRDYGEERFAGRIASFIETARKKKRIETTGELVEIIKAAIPAANRREGPHPAKRTFQAIRIEVNGELMGLRKAVEDFCDVLNPGGRMAIISFHSLEDRIAKEVFARRENPCTCPKDIPVCVCGKVADIKRITRKPIVPGDEEEGTNHRARSAKLRVAEKI